jgi:TolA-binding protein
MKQKPALLISLFLTVFTLVMISSVVAKAFGGGFTAPVNEEAPAQIDAGITSDITELEKAYQEVIDQANQQIVSLQGQVQALSAEDVQQNTESGNLIGAEEAVNAALEVAISGSDLAGEAELVDFEGTVAYEVPFDSGNIYIDAETGEVLFNGTISLAPAKIDANTAARIASEYMKRTDVYKVETVSLNGQEVYKVKFNNGDVVYINEFGQLIMVRLAGGGGASGEHHEGNNEHENNDD